MLVAVLGGLGSMVYSLGDEAAALIESLPDAAQKLRQSMRAARGTPESSLEKVQRAGGLLGVPLLMAVKAVCDRVDDLKPIGELLGA
jgi:predicted PurR-regulated permease PerM